MIELREKKPCTHTHTQTLNEWISIAVEICLKACINYNIFLHIQLSTSYSDQNIKKDKWLSALWLLLVVIDAMI